MGYTVELLFDVRKDTSILQRQQVILNKAESFGCSLHYTMHEMEGKGTKTTRSDYILVVSFDEDKCTSMLSFIHLVKQLRICYIDCIYTDDTECKILYASSNYLKHLDKATSLNIRRYIKHSKLDLVECIRKAMMV